RRRGFAPAASCRDRLGVLAQLAYSGQLRLDVPQALAALLLGALRGLGGPLQRLRIGTGELLCQAAVVVAQLPLDAAQRVAGVLAHHEAHLVAVAADGVLGLVLPRATLTLLLLPQSFAAHHQTRSEERRVGKEGRC